jgi:uncharacterized small protein (DUF1192 family)
MFDEDRPKPKPPVHEIGQPLDQLSIKEIETRIAALQAEILRLEQAKASKGSARSVAEGLFRI